MSNVRNGLLMMSLVLISFINLISTVNATGRNELLLVELFVTRAGDDRSFFDQKEAFLKEMRRRSLELLGEAAVDAKAPEIYERAKAFADGEKDEEYSLFVEQRLREKRALRVHLRFFINTQPELKEGIAVLVRVAGDRSKIVDDKEKDIVGRLYQRCYAEVRRLNPDFSTAVFADIAEQVIRKAWMDDYSLSYLTTGLSYQILPKSVESR
jgi:hypothetical protein